MSTAKTLSRKIQPSSVTSIMELEKNKFHVTSYFDQRTPLSEVLFSAANENLFKNPFLDAAIPPLMLYNGVED